LHGHCAELGDPETEQERAGGSGRDPVKPVRLGDRWATTREQPASLTGQLTLLPSPSVDDMLGVNQPYGEFGTPPSFVLQGNEMVATISGTLFEVANLIVGTGTATPFSVDWYVNRQSLTVLGLRNFSVGSPKPICNHPPI
jgi:hypothetical protein